MKHNYKYILTFIVSFCIVLSNVNASSITFSENGKRMCYNSGSNLNYIGYTKENCKSDYGDKYESPEETKWKTFKNGNDSGNAYCSDMELSFRPSNDTNEYVLDNNYNSTACKYYKPTLDASGNITNWPAETSYTNGDCSSLVGYVIAKANVAANKAGYSSEKSFALGQAAVWAYLGKFSTGTYLQATNDEAKTVYSNNSEIKKILQEAFKEYTKNQGSHNTTQDKTNTLKENMLQLPQNLKFYYKPNISSNNCDASIGVYETDWIEIVNKHNENVKLTIEPLIAGYDIEYELADGTKNITNQKIEITLMANNNTNNNDTVKIKLKASSYISNPRISITSKTEVTESTTQGESYTVYDSQRYKLKSGDANYQALIILGKPTTHNGELTIKESFYDEDIINFSMDKIVTTPPPAGENLDDTGICANNSGGGTPVTLYDSICKVITLADGSQVNILLRETVNFTYGNLYKYTKPLTNETLLYSGGGFTLNNDQSLGKTTNYEVSVEWGFANKVEGTGKPYYYNPNDKTQTDASGLTSVIEEQIISESEGIKNNLTNLNIGFDTYDSNYLKSDGTGKNLDVDYILKLRKVSEEIKGTNNAGTEENYIKANAGSTEKTINIDNIGFKNNTDTTFIRILNLKLNKLNLKKYKMKGGENGIVEYLEYNDDNIYELDEGNRAYFVPMNYPTGTFKFNIKDSNLSIIKEIDLNYNATCALDVENRFSPEPDPTPTPGDKGKGVVYRTISVENPFPKVDTNNENQMPANWFDWYKDTANQNRITKTYEKESIYEIEITSSKQSTIESYNNGSFYNEWKNIVIEDNTPCSGTSGTSCFITNSSLFDKKANNNSYCEIGRFHLDCDQ